MYVLDIKNVKDIKDKELIEIFINGIKKEIYIEKQRTGFGYKYFFSCPNCEERRTKLYTDDQLDLYCRSCKPNKMYKGITHTTKGGEDNISYRMYRIAEKYNIKFKFPFSYYQLLNERPKYMRLNKWKEVVRKLQILENMRNQAIFFKNKYSPSLIKYVLENCLYVYNLQELDDYFIDWAATANKLRKYEKHFIKESSLNFASP